jgi:hypothetical protein
MIEIQLTQSKITLIDNEDEDLAYLKWYVYHQGSTLNPLWYARRALPRVNGKQTHVSMHRLILERKIGRSLFAWEQTDHADNDTLNNQRYNLRVVSTPQNQHNQRIHTIGKKGNYKGVDWKKNTNKWRARIQINHNRIEIGYFDTEIKAARAYDEAAKIYCGEHAHLNFSEDYGNPR